MVVVEGIPATVVVVVGGVDVGGGVLSHVKSAVPPDATTS